MLDAGFILTAPKKTGLILSTGLNLLKGYAIDDIWIYNTQTIILMDFLLDASFIIFAMEKRIDIEGGLSEFGEPFLSITDAVKREIMKLAEGGSHDGGTARAALEWIERQGMIVIASGPVGADEGMINSAKEYEMAVCTQDARLKKRLKSEGVKVFTIRNMGKIEEDQS